jgi:hypothetical protein
VLPRFKVIVPCYRYASFLEGCVASVLSQEGVDVRVLVIDDCSPDETPAVAEMLLSRDQRVEYRRHDVNQGLIATANEGLEWAAGGDYTVLLSADDLLVPRSLARAATVMDAHPNVGMVYGRSLYAYEGRPLPDAHGHWRGTDVWRGIDWIRVRCRSGYNCISSPEVVVRTSVQQSVGRYDPECYHCSDLQMWLRVAAVADVAYVRGVGQAIYRIQPEGMFRSAAAPMVDLSERRKAFDTFFASSGAQLRGADRLQATAGRALARQALWQASRAIARGLDTGSDPVPVDELTAFAFDVCSGARRLAEWRGLRLRRALGATHSRYFPPFLATGAVHRARGHALKLRWKLKGI